MSIPMYNAGDVVKVVDRPNRKCYFGWCHEMEDLCGQDVTIAEVTTDHWGPSDVYGYRVKEDPNDFLWSESSFVPIKEIEESDMDISVLLV